ncbi:MAG: hypothetical protein IK092_01490, partial [Muribaculaceae bacterium]|nr:hypothetical protein [Muribaculaceae bacterium]
PPAVNGLYFLLGMPDQQYKATLYVPRGCKEIYKNDYPWAYFPEIVEFDDNLQGDVNNDYIVDIRDVSSLINSLLDGSTDLLLDINNDGEIDVQDVTALINLILQ